MTDWRGEISWWDLFFPAVKIARSSQIFVSAAHSLLLLLAVTATGRAQPLGENTGKAEVIVQPATPKLALNDDGFLVVGFDTLASFDFTPPSNEAATGDGKSIAVKGDDQIPARIRALNAKKVVVTGFMLPIKMDQGLVKEFLLVKDPMMCCYGVMPKLNEWVVVKMVAKGVPPLMDVPISFEGKLSVGVLYDNGYLTGLYLLEGEKQQRQNK